MSDLIARLLAACNGREHVKIAWPHRILHEAADTIRQQAALIEAGAERERVMREALEYILEGHGLNPPDFKDDPDDQITFWVVEAARAALTSPKVQP